MEEVVRAFNYVIEKGWVSRLTSDVDELYLDPIMM